MNDAMTEKPLLSLFSGAGGLDLGFEYAGFKTALALDHETSAVATHNANFAAGTAMVRDLSKLNLAWIQRKARELDVRGVIGGPPCQGFSKGNVLKDARDPRNRLVFAFADVLRHLNRAQELDFFLLENVAGLLEPKQAGRYQRLVSQLCAAGFRVQVLEVNAADFGIAQTRRRVFFVGLNSASYAKRELKLRFSNSPKTVRDVLQDLPEATLFERGIGPADIAYHPNHWTMQPRSARFKKGRFNRWRSFRKLDWDAPSPTVAYGNREIHIHPDGHRRLTVLEAMLLQGLPKRFVIHGNLSEQVTQVSNLVPPPMARAAARAIAHALR